MIAIYKRELKAFFDTMVGWIFIAAIMFITGIYFIAINILGGYGNVAYTISNAQFIYIIAIPLLTMRILAEERKQKIDQLIFTAPVSLFKVVFGKYLAMCTVLLCPMLVICTYPLVLSRYGTVSFAQTYVAILGFFLYGMASIALGLFMSSLTESVVIAAVLSFAAMFITFIMQGLVSMLASNVNAFTTLLTKILGCINFGAYFDDLLNGILDFRAIIYFVIVSLVFLFLTTQVIQKRRFTVSKNTFKVGAYSTTMIVVVVAAAVIANSLVAAIPDKYMAIDATSTNLYSITDTTKNLLANLDKDVTLYVINDENSKDEVIDKTIRQYASASSHISFEYKDPARYPSFYKQYGDSSMSYNSVIVVCGDRYKVVDSSDMYETTIDYNTYTSTTTGYDGEGQLTSAINYVTRDDMPKAYNITGHSETKVGSNFTDAIEKMNVEISDLNLMSVDAVPEDAEFLMIIAPQTDFSADDAQKIIDYANNGGKLYICTCAMDDPAGTLPNFQKILDNYKATVIPGAIIEQNAKNYYQSPIYILPNVKSSTLTTGVYNEKYIIAPYTQGLVVDDSSDDITVETILESSDQATTYTEAVAANEEAEAEEASEPAAPFNLGCHITKTTDGKTSNLFLFTSFYMLSNDADNMVSNANSTLFGNCIATYVSADTGNISIPVKAYNSESLMIDSAMGLVYGVLFTVIIPLVLILAGFVIWFRRRKR